MVLILHCCSMTAVVSIGPGTAVVDLGVVFGLSLVFAEVIGIGFA